MDIDKIKAIASKPQFEEILKQNDIKSVSVFGSVAKGTQKSDSDIDLLVDYFPTSKRTLFTRVKLQDQLELLFNTEVDIVNKKFINKHIQEDILNFEIPIYAR